MVGPFPDLQPMTPIASPLALAQSADQYQRMQALTPLEIGMAQLNMQKAQQLAPIEVGAAQTSLDSAKLGLDTASKLAPYKITAAGQQSDADTRAYQNGLLVDAARAAQAADPADAPAVWDQKMQEAADKGVKVANQYVGNYRQQLAESVLDVYGAEPGGRARAGAGGAGAATDDEAFLRGIQNVPAEKLTQSLGKYNEAIAAFNRVKTPEDLKSEVDQLRQAGVPVDKMLPGVDFSRTDKASFATNYAAVQNLINKSARQRDMIAQRVQGLAVGVPQPSAPPLYKPSNPNLSGYTKDGRPVYVERDQDTGKLTFETGPAGVTPRPSAGSQTFLTKQGAWLATHPGDNQGALDYANGKRQLSPQQIRQYASTEAARQLYDLTLADPGFQPQGGPEAWINQRTNELEQEINSAGQPAAPAAAGPAQGAKTPPPNAGYRQAPDGNYYRPDPARPGKFLKWAAGK